MAGGAVRAGHSVGGRWNGRRPLRRIIPQGPSLLGYADPDILAPMKRFPLPPDDEALTRADADALAAAVAESDADPRTAPHEEVREWLLRLAAGDRDAKPPVPR